MSIRTVSITLIASVAWTVATAQDSERQSSATTPPEFLDHDESAVQFGHQFRASKLIGTRIHNDRGDEIGEVEDLIVAADRSVVAVIVSVGGFLDVGDRLVALPYTDVRASTNGELYVAITKEALAARPPYTPSAVWSTPTEQPPALETDAQTLVEANEEADDSFAGNDPRVAEGIADNKEAYAEEKSSEAP
jgi:sporulation protein YlmC with PRC-barrel domain